MPEDPQSGTLLETPLHQWHVEAGARMVPFAGWSMPVYYGGITRESLAVRKRAGMFDVSHMARLEVSGHGAGALLQLLTTNDLAALTNGGGQYTLMLRPDGGVLDDLIVYRRAPDRFLVIANASNREKIFNWIRTNASATIAVHDNTLATALVAVQGPEALKALESLGMSEPPQRFHLAPARIAGVDCTLSRTGYTGEDGVEIIARAEDAAALWQQLAGRGVEPCGLGSRDTLRLEAAYCLYGHELDEEINPIEAGLSWVVKCAKEDFIGREAILKIKAGGARRSIIGIEMPDRSVPRPGQNVLINGSVVGKISSGTYSPILEKSIALAMTTAGSVPPGTTVDIDSGNKLRSGTARALPFYRSSSLQSNSLQSK